MRTSLCLLIFICFFVFSSHGQENKKANERLFDEFTASLNLTTSSTTYFPQGMHNRFGVGIGAYHGFRRGKTFTPLFGVEYNFTSQYYRKISEDKYLTETDVKVHNHCISLPVDFRFNTATRNKLFFQLGVFVDFNFIETKKGNYDQSNPYWLDSTTFKKSSGNSGTFKHTYAFPNFPNAGFSGGMGCDIPLEKINLIVRAEYKFGLVGLLADGTDYLGYIRLSVGVRLHPKDKK